MGYFNYHAKVQKRIKEIGVENVKILDAYHNISPCMLITLQNGECYPIRERMFAFYIEFIEKSKIT